VGDTSRGRESTDCPELAHPPPQSTERAMDEKEHHQRVDHAVLRLVRLKAKQIAGRYGFHKDEFEDIQQTLIAQCLQRMAL